MIFAVRKRSFRILKFLFQEILKSGYFQVRTISRSVQLKIVYTFLCILLQSSIFRWRGFPHLNSQGEIGNDSSGAIPTTDESPKYIILPILHGWNLSKYNIFFSILNSPENTLNMLYNLLFRSIVNLKNNYVNKVIQLYSFFAYQMLYSVLSYKFQLGTSNLIYCSCSFLGRLNRIWRYVTLSLKSAIYCMCSFQKKIAVWSFLWFKNCKLLLYHLHLHPLNWVKW